MGVVRGRVGSGVREFARHIIASGTGIALVPAAPERRVQKDHCRQQVGKTCAHGQLRPVLARIIAVIGGGVNMACE
jgi:hypothetical protein